MSYFFSKKHFKMNALSPRLDEGKLDGRLVLGEVLVHAGHPEHHGAL
jgi:hypothetical protein